MSTAKAPVIPAIITNREGYDFQSYRFTAQKDFGFSR